MCPNLEVWAGDASGYLSEQRLHDLYELYRLHDVHDLLQFIEEHDLFRTVNLWPVLEQPKDDLEGSKCK